MKINIGKVFQAIGKGTLIAAETTPQGALVGGILRRIKPVAKGLGLTDQNGNPIPAGATILVPVPGDLDGDGIPDEVDLRAVAVEAVMETLPDIITFHMSNPGKFNPTSTLTFMTDCVHAFLIEESARMIEESARMQKQAPSAGMESK